MFCLCLSPILPHISSLLIMTFPVFLSNQNQSPESQVARLCRLLPCYQIFGRTSCPLFFWFYFEDGAAGSFIMLVPSYHGTWHIAEEQSLCTLLCETEVSHLCRMILSDVSRQVDSWLIWAVHIMLAGSLSLTLYLKKKNHPIPMEMGWFPFLGGSFKCTHFSVHLPALKTT